MEPERNAPILPQRDTGVRSANNEVDPYRTPPQPPQGTTGRKCKASFHNDGVTAQSPFAPDAQGVWTGNGTELHIDGDDSCEIALLDKTVERGSRTVLWSGTLTVPKAGDGPTTIELPLDATAVQAIRDQLRAEPKR